MAELDDDCATQGMGAAINSRNAMNGFIGNIFMILSLFRL